MCKASEINIHALLLHVGQLFHVLLHALHILFGLVGIKNIVEVGIVIRRDFIVQQIGICLFHHVGQNVALNGLHVVARIAAINELLVNRQQQRFELFALGSFECCREMRIAAFYAVKIFVGQHQAPTHQRTLPQLVVVGLLPHLPKQGEARGIDAIESTQHHGRNQRLGIVNIYQRT